MLRKKVFSQQNSIVALLIVIEAASHKHALPKLISILLRIMSIQRLLCCNFKFPTLYWNNILHTLLVKHYNDLLERQSSERGKDEVSYFYVGDVFCIHLGTK